MTACDDCGTHLNPVAARIAYDPRTGRYTCPACVDAQRERIAQEASA